MSLILGYANKDNAIIMSDGRAGGTVCPSEEYDKTRKINNNIILGFSGYQESSEHFLSCIHMKLGERIKYCYIEEFLEVVEYGMSLDSTKEYLHSSFIIIGRTKNKHIMTTIVGNNTQYKMDKHIVTNVRHLAIGGTIDGEKIFEIYEKNLSNHGMSIQSCMIKTIHGVSLLDSSVNTNTFAVMI